MRGSPELCVRQRSLFFFAADEGHENLELVLFGFAGFSFATRHRHVSGYLLSFLWRLCQASAFEALSILTTPTYARKNNEKAREEKEKLGLRQRVCYV